MVALISSTIVGIVLLLPIFYFAKRRPVGATFTWGEALVAGVYAFFVMFWFYGVIPHHWLTWADSELNWRPDRIWFGPEGQVVMPTGWALETPWFPIKVSAQIFRDIIVTLMYVVFLGVQMWMWSWWQKRGTRAAAVEAVEPVSSYGRPLMKRA